MEVEHKSKSIPLLKTDSEMFECIMQDNQQKVITKISLSWDILLNFHMIG